MLKHVVTPIAAVLLALPAVALGSTPPKAASASCKSQLTAMGATNFAAQYKTMGACVSQMSKATAHRRASLLSAEKQCRTQELANATAFAATYGTSGKAGKNSSQANAFGKCVSKLAPV